MTNEALRNIALDTDKLEAVLVQNMQLLIDAAGLVADALTQVRAAKMEEIEDNS